MTENAENPENAEHPETGAAGPDDAAEQAGLTIARFPETLAVARLAPGADIPEWAESSSVFAIVATAIQTTVVCAGRSVPKKVPHRKPFTAFQVVDERAPGAVAPLVALLGPLAEAGLEAFPVATYDAEWLLVPAGQADRAEEAWRRSGHTVAPAVPV